MRIIRPARSEEEGFEGVSRKVLLIDNYDSFAFNLAQYLAELYCEVIVVRNDESSLEELKRQKPTHLVISPGPGTPADAGISREAVRTFAGFIPILGVCLGHQVIGEVMGGKIIRGEKPVHGKTSLIHHDGKTVFREVSNPFQATRYHSLIVERESIHSSLEVSCETEEGVIMGIRHRNIPCEGVQFHPESILTLEGKKILSNFLELGI